MTIGVDEGFAGFSRGTIGSAGANLYVSAAGVLQRIQLMSLEGDVIDLPFANTHDDDPRVPVLVLPDPTDPRRDLALPSNGAYAMAIADLTGDGYDDLVIANQHDGATTHVAAQVYFGGPDGYSPRRCLELWAPSSTDVAVGRFNGRTPSLVFLSQQSLRVFTRGERGFASSEYVDLAFPDTAESIECADLDGDGYDDLVVRTSDSGIVVFYGSEHGLDPDRRWQLPRNISGDRALKLGVDLAATGGASTTTGKVVYGVPIRPRLKVARDGDRSLLLVLRESRVLLVEVGRDRARVVDEAAVENAASATLADLRGSGERDLVVVTREPVSPEGTGLVLWRDREGFAGARRTGFAVTAANDVVVSRPDGPGSAAHILVCQDMLPDSYSHASELYRVDGEKIEHLRSIATACALDAGWARLWGDERTRPVFAQHLANSVLGNIDSQVFRGRSGRYGDDDQLRLPGHSATGIRLVDLHDTGRTDVVLVNNGENDASQRHASFVYRQPSDGGTWSLAEQLPTTKPMSVAIADFRRRGRLDLVFAPARTDHLELFESTPDGFVGPIPIPLPASAGPRRPRFLSCADLDGDGWLDLVVPDLGDDGGLLILYGGPDGFDPARSQVIPSGKVLSSRVADLDGDGWLDLVVGGYTGDDEGDPYRTHVYIYWGGPEGYSNDRRQQLPGQFVHDLCVADLDRDGRLDIVVSNYHGLRTRDLDSVIYWNSADGFSPENSTRFPVGSGAGVLAADLDGNGWKDLVLIHHKQHGNHSTRSEIWHNGPEGFRPEARTLLTTAGPHAFTGQDIGHVADRGPEEEYLSAWHPFHPESSQPTIRVAWDGDVPETCWIRIEARWVAEGDDPATASWHPLPAISGSAAEGIVAARVAAGALQYRLFLGARESIATPRISRVTVSATGAA